MFKREDAIKAIGEERDYQNNLKKAKDKYNELDYEKSIADFLVFIEYHLTRAKIGIYHLDEAQALDEVRKIGALTVACMETHGIIWRDKK